MNGIFRTGKDLTGDDAVFRGDTINFVVGLKDGATGDPLNIANWTFWLTIKAHLEDLDSAAAFQTAVPAGSIPSPESGIANITIPASESALIAPGMYWYDIQGSPAPGEIVTLGRWKVEFKADVTRTTVTP